MLIGFDTVNSNLVNFVLWNIMVFLAIACIDIVNEDCVSFATRLI